MIFFPEFQVKKSGDPAFKSSCDLIARVTVPRHYTPSSKIDLLYEGIDRYLETGIAAGSVGVLGTAETIDWIANLV